MVEALIWLALCYLVGHITYNIDGRVMGPAFWLGTLCIITLSMVLGVSF